MKSYKIVVLLIILLTCSACIKRECARSVGNLTMNSIVEENTGEAALGLENWFHSEFQSEQLHFSLEFSHFGAGEFCDYYWNNYPLESSIEIYCNKDILIGSETIFSNNKLNDYFIIEKVEKDYQIAFLLTEITQKKIKLNSDYYTFSVKLITTNNEEMTDECIVKWN